jgi:hypothetical protein
MTTKVQDAVLEVTTTMHNWRNDPSPKNAEQVTIAVQLVIGLALELDRKVGELEEAAERKQ